MVTGPTRRSSDLSAAQSGTVQEDVTATASGQVVAADVDHDAVLTYSANSLAGTYGSLALDASTGEWTYTLANDQTLSANDVFTDTFTRSEERRVGEACR